VLEGTSKLYKDTEIMFIVDTTGSMSDEMLFLQSEFSAIAREVGSDNVKYAVSFYRDEGDDYVTKHNDFTSDVSSLQKALNNETADGGGDFPEAVAQILTETITDDTILVTDHDDGRETEVTATLGHLGDPVDGYQSVLELKVRGLYSFNICICHSPD
jgi:hypothetical protein